MMVLLMAVGRLLKNFLLTIDFTYTKKRIVDLLIVETLGWINQQADILHFWTVMIVILNLIFYLK